MLALATADHDLAAVDVDVLDTDAQALGAPEAAAVEEVGDEAEGVVEVIEEEEDLAPGEDRREVLGPPGTLESLELRHRAADDVAVKEDDGAESLVLGGSGSATLHREMIEECGEVGGAEVTWVAAAVIADEGPDPVGVRLLSAG